MTPRRTEPELLAFARRLGEMRLYLGLSQEALAEIVGVHVTYLRKIETCRWNPTLVTIQRLADGLGVSVAHLVADE